jgi:hypothetical protein
MNRPVQPVPATPASVTPPVPAAVVGAQFQAFDLGDYPLTVGPDGIERLV